MTLMHSATRYLDSPKVTVVVLSYKRPHLLEEALASVTNQSHRNMEILLIDNFSSLSDQIASVAARFPEVQLIANKENVGFAKGMNQGVHAAVGDFTLLTEDDIVLDRDCIHHLLAFALSAHEEMMLSGLVINKTDGTILSAGASLSLGGIYKMCIYGRGEKDEGQFNQPLVSDYIPGCMIFARTRLLNKLGCFRPDFFMYAEDSELSVRFRRRGGRLMIVPAARAYHFEPAPHARSERIDRSKVRNFFALYLLHAPARVFPEFLFRYVFLDMIRAVFNDRRQARILFGAVLSIASQIGELLRQRLQPPYRQVE